MASIALLPDRGGPGLTVHISGAGFTADSPLVLSFGPIPIPLSVDSSDGSGAFSGTFLVPHLPVGDSDIYVVIVQDSLGVIATAEFAMCRDGTGDGVDSTVAPILASAGIVSDTLEPQILAYAHHDGAHYIAWLDPTVLDVSDVLTVYPPPAHHTLNVTMVPDDGGAIVNFELDTDYCWAFASTATAFLCQCTYLPFSQVDPVWENSWWFDTAWSKPVFDVKFASDGTTLWLAVLTRETVPYPWLSSGDTVSCGEGVDACTSESQLAQFAPLDELTANFSFFPRSSGEGFSGTYHPAVGVPDDFWYHVQTPTSDGGDHLSGHWSPPRVVMFAGGQGGFTRIGTMDAKYCPGQTNGTAAASAFRGGLAQTSPQGTFFSGVSIAASEAEPGVCHLVWSEGGDWGTCGLGEPLDEPSAAGFDGGPPNRDYRVGHSTWDAAGKTSETDLFSSHIDRNSFYFMYDDGDGLLAYGYSWPEEAQLAATGFHAVRNDHGSPVLFIAWPKVVTNPDQLEPDADGRPWLDRALVLGRPEIEMYDIAGGAPMLLQTLDGDLLPTEDETAFYYAGNPNSISPFAPDSLMGGIEGYEMDQTDTFTRGQPFTTLDRAFAVSRLYEDPLLGGDPVYLLAAPWCRTIDQAGDPRNAMRSFYRVPVDGSAPFDMLDGTRQLLFTVMDDFIGVSFGGGANWTSQDFYSDPHNIWVPHAGTSNSPFVGLQFDRICRNQWAPYSEVPAAAIQQDAQGWGSDYDTDADTISIAAFSNDLPVTLFDYVVYKLCRECSPCKCTPVGLHIWQVL